MKQIILEREGPINMAALDADLRATVGTGYVGLNVHRGNVIVFFEDYTASDLVNQAADIVANHDASDLTPEQATEQARQQAIQSARASHPTGIDLSAFQTSDADVQTLADLVAWLELEIRDLRGL